MITSVKEKQQSIIDSHKEAYPPFIVVAILMFLMMIIFGQMSFIEMSVTVIISALVFYGVYRLFSHFVIHTDLQQVLKNSKEDFIELSTTAKNHGIDASTYNKLLLKLTNKTITIKEYSLLLDEGAAITSILQRRALLNREKRELEQAQALQ